MLHQFTSSFCVICQRYLFPSSAVIKNFLITAFSLSSPSENMLFKCWLIAGADTPYSAVILYYLSAVLVSDSSTNAAGMEQVFNASFFLQPGFLQNRLCQLRDLIRYRAFCSDVDHLLRTKPLERGASFDQTLPMRQVVPAMTDYMVEGVTKADSQTRFVYAYTAAITLPVRM